MDYQDFLAGNYVQKSYGTDGANAERRSGSRRQTFPHIYTADCCTLKVYHSRAHETVKLDSTCTGKFTVKRAPDQRPVESCRSCSSSLCGSHCQSEPLSKLPVQSIEEFVLCWTELQPRDGDRRRVLTIHNDDALLRDKTATRKLKRQREDSMSLPHLSPV